MWLLNIESKDGEKNARDYLSFESHYGIKYMRKKPKKIKTIAKTTCGNIFKDNINRQNHWKAKSCTVDGIYIDFGFGTSVYALLNYFICVKNWQKNEQNMQINNENAKMFSNYSGSGLWYYFGIGLDIASHWHL